MLEFFKSDKKISDFFLPAGTSKFFSAARGGNDAIFFLFEMLTLELPRLDEKLSFQFLAHFFSRAPLVFVGHGGERQSLGALT